MSIKIQVRSNKGGVAKTTSAVNIGHCLANKGYKVLIVDADGQANITDYLLGGVEFIGKRPGINKLLETGSKLNPEDVVVESRIDNLFVLPNEKIDANGSTYSLTSIIGDHPVFQNIIKNLLKNEFFNDFDYTIFDCGPANESDAVSIQVGCDYLLIPSTPVHDGLTGLKSALDFLEEINSYMDPCDKTEFLGVIACSINNTLGEHKDCLKHLKEGLGDYLFQNNIPQSQKAYRFSRTGKTIMDFPKDKAAIAYELATSELIQKIEALKKSKTKKNKRAPEANL